MTNAVYPRELQPVTDFAKIPVKVQWRSELGATPTITTSVWESVPTGLAISDETTPDSNQSAQAWFTNFTAGQNYILVNKVTTDESPAKKLEARIKVRCMQADETD